MFIDISTYIGHWPFRNLKYNTLEGLDHLAQDAGITHMVVANLHGLFYKDANVANLELLEALKAYQGKTKFLALAMVDRGFVCAVASDGHSPHYRTTWMGDVGQLLAEEFSPETAWLLTDEHPRLLLEDQTIYMKEPYWF